MSLEQKRKVFWYCEKWQPGGIQLLQLKLLKHMNMDALSFDVVVSQDETSLFDIDLVKAGARKIVTLKKHYDSPALRTVCNIFAVAGLLRKGKYDVAHFNACHGVELIYIFWAWLFRVPVRIAHCRNNDIGAGGRSRKIKLLAHKICKCLFGGFANVRLANSDLAAKWLFGESALKKGKVEILKNGIDAYSFQFNAEGRNRVRQELGIENSFVIGHIGHFSYQKNHEFLLDVFYEILQIEPTARLLLIGTGGGEQKVRKKAQELGIADSVIFYGISDDIPSLMWAMDAFVLPSRFEGFGNVLLEAQAAGLKCFASKDVIPDAVKVCENLHWISLDESAGKWARKIEFEAKDYRRNDMTSDVVGAGYSINSMAKRLNELYA